ncbi:TPA: hypothetical protein DCZ90_03310 [Candidatus Amesbacteria bacterium]|nr:hypothetical protein [Candidatus Amesbacteria bacterium]
MLFWGRLPGSGTGVEVGLTADPGSGVISGAGVAQQSVLTKLVLKKFLISTSVVASPVWITALPEFPEAELPPVLADDLISFTTSILFPCRTFIDDPD